jgi:hypothetical protein
VTCLAKRDSDINGRLLGMATRLHMAVIQQMGKISYKNIYRISSVIDYNVDLQLEQEVTQ